MTVCLSLCLSTYMCVFLYHCLSTPLYFCMFFYLSSYCTCFTVSLSASLLPCPHLPACVSIGHIDVRLSVCFLHCLPGVSVFLHVCLPVNLHSCLSLSMPVYSLIIFFPSSCLISLILISYSSRGLKLSIQSS